MRLEASPSGREIRTDPPVGHCYSIEVDIIYSRGYRSQFYRSVRVNRGRRHMQDTEALDIQELVNIHQMLIHSTATDDDTFSLAQPSPLKYVPSITTNQSVLSSEDRLNSQR